MEIFIGSSSEQETVVHRIKDKIKMINSSYHPLPWFYSFPACEYTMESLINVTKKANCAIFIFAKDDKVSNGRGEFIKTRDNVIFEYGLFVGALGIKNVLIICKDNVDIPSDLKGFTHVFLNEDFESKLTQWLNGVENKEISVDKDDSGSKALKNDKEGYYYSSVVDIRDRISKKNGKKYKIYKMNGTIDKYLVDNESHWLCYEEGKFTELKNLDKVKFKIDCVDKLKEYEGEKSRNIYVTDVVKL